MAIYPDWVLKHKVKGTYVNVVGDKYYLYAAHSVRIKGTNKVRRINDGYIGRITEKDGIIPSRKKTASPIFSYEFGLSFAIISCTKNIHSGLRKSFVKHGDLIYVASILSYMYNYYDKDLFDLSYLHFHFSDLVFPIVFSDAQQLGIERGTRMIASTLIKYFNEDLNMIKAHFSTVTIINIDKNLCITSISDNATLLSLKYSIKWEDALWQK